MTPNELIVDFIRRQPEQTRDSLCAGFVMVSRRTDFSSSDEAAQIAFDLIDAPGTYSKAMAAASAIGIIDYFFWFPPLDPDRLADMAEEAGSPVLEDLARRMELTNAYRERAAKEWRTLRQGGLSYEALRRYEGSLRP